MRIPHSTLRRALFAVIAPIALISAVATAPASAATQPAPPTTVPPLSAPMKKATPAHGAKTAAAAFYEVAVRTGDFSGAGTDGDVWVWIDGTGGRSGWLYLDNSDDNFERNKTDYFNFVLNDLGYVQTIYVYFSPGGWWPDWYLNYVTVNGAYFPAYRWFTNSGYVGINRA